MNLSKKANGRLVLSCRKMDGGVEFEYCLYENNEVDDRPSYSISVVTVVDGIRDEAYFNDVTSVESIASELFRIISESSVSSCTLGDVLEDLIG